MAVSEQQQPVRQRDSRPRKALTIGAVCKILENEFDDISISKIRYLEDQKLLTPRRTQGGYRLYSQSDVERLRTILRLQRDEFLPLRVIRQELAAGGELLADHPQRQELVAPQAQDRAQPLDVGLAVEAVAALGAARRQQLLVLQVADLRDRDLVCLLYTS